MPGTVATAAAALAFGDDAGRDAGCASAATATSAEHAATLLRRLEERIVGSVKRVSVNPASRQRRLRRSDDASTPRHLARDRVARARDDELEPGVVERRARPS